MYKITTHDWCVDSENVFTNLDVQVETRFFALGELVDTKRSSSSVTKPVYNHGVESLSLTINGTAVDRGSKRERYGSILLLLPILPFFSCFTVDR